jgi:hypothetical protein
LAEEMSVTQASMSTMIVRLAELGFVTKAVDASELRNALGGFTPGAPRVGEAGKRNKSVL